MDQARPPLRGLTLALATLVLALGTFMEVVDTTIANVAVPHIAGDLGVSATRATWVITSYAAANAISMLLSGWLAQRFGQVRVFVAAVGLFTLASWLCGLAPTFGLLLTFRVLQGGVSGLMVPLSQTLLMASWPKARQGAALAIWSMTVMVAPVLGPILGGWITDRIGWSWIFYINLPVGVAVAFLAWQLLAARESARRRVPIDAVGLGLMVIGVGALQIMLDKGNELDWFGSTVIVVLAIVAALGLVLFVAWELTERHPIVDLRLFAIRNFSAGTLALSLGFGVFFGNIVLLPLWLQTQMGYTATWAGLVMAPFGVLAVVFTPAVGKNLARVDPRLFASAAFLIFAAASSWRAGYTPDADYWSLVAPQFLQGAGLALFIAPLMVITLGGLTPEELPFGAGLANFLRNIARSIGASLVTTLWQRREVLHHTRLVENINAYAPQASDAIDRLGHAGLSTGGALARINAELVHQTTLMAANDIFWLSGWLFVLLIGVVWLARRTAPGRPVLAH